MDSIPVKRLVLGATLCAILMIAIVLYILVYAVGGVVLFFGLPIYGGYKVSGEVRDMWKDGNLF